VNGSLFVQRQAPTAARRICGLAVSAPLHLAAVALCAFLAAQSIASVPSRGRSIVVTYVSAPGDSTSAQDLVLAADEDANRIPPRRLDVAGFHFDIERIRARREALFPFLTADLMFLDPIRDERRAAEGRLVNPFGTGAQAMGGAPLVMSDAALQETIDRAWSRRGRWRVFEPIAALLMAHDANRGRAPDVVRAYVDQNILQLFCQGRTKDPALWGVLENAADHTEFIDFVRSFARERPFSRTTTELLFLLDELAQASRDALLVLVGTDLRLDLQETARSRPDAYDLALTLKRHYGAWLAERDLTSPAAIRTRYDDLRLRLLSTIVESSPGGYRSGDARFLAGEIWFGRGDVAEALRWWRGMAVDPAGAQLDLSSRLATAVNRGSLRAMEIERILGSASGRRTVAMIDRMWRFGHTCDTF
jgi:hypothetical protein